MTYLERKKKEEYLLYLIEKERFYSLEKIAENYGCSVRTVKRMIFNLRDEGNRNFVPQILLFCDSKKLHKTSRF
jgi:DNA invertase Pin-like site-specific DNA recombinase